MSKTNAQTGMHMHRLAVANWLSIKAMVVDAKGDSVIFHGPNGAGKSAMLWALWVALKGLDTRLHPEPVKDGADQAELTLDLGDLKIERVIAFNEKTQRAETVKLIVTRADGSKVRTRPQEMLDSLLGKFSMDPIEFMSMRPIDRVDQVLKRAGVAPPVDKVEEITGKKHPARENESASSYLERLSADESGLYYVERAAANRVLIEKENAVRDQQRELQALGGALTEDEEPGSVGDKLEEIARLQRADQERRKAIEEAEQAARESKDARTSLEKRIAAADALKAELARLEREIAAGKQYLGECDAWQEEKEAYAKDQPDHGPLIKQLTDQVEQHEKAVKAVRRRQSVMEQVDRLSQERTEAEERHGRLDTILNKIRDIRRHLLDGVDLGVSGLTIDKGDVRIDGHPFTQAPMSHRIRLACKIAMDPAAKVHIVRVDGLEQLDDESMKILFNTVHAEGWELVGARVENEKQLGFDIVAA